MANGAESIASWLRVGRPRGDDLDHVVQAEGTGLVRAEERMTHRTRSTSPKRQVHHDIHRTKPGFRSSDGTAMGRLIARLLMLKDEEGSIVAELLNSSKPLDLAARLRIIVFVLDLERRRRRVYYDETGAEFRD